MKHSLRVFERLKKSRVESRCILFSSLSCNMSLISFEIAMPQLVWFKFANKYLNEIYVTETYVTYFSIKHCLTEINIPNMSHVISFFPPLANMIHMVCF
jgi:hypothetical protein